MNNGQSVATCHGALLYIARCHNMYNVKTQFIVPKYK